MPEHFRRVFESEDLKSARAKFLSRVFGIFSEEVVKVWARNSYAPYENLGRPTLRRIDDGARHTIDFTLKDRRTKAVFVAEMKCEIQYQNFAYFVLKGDDQLEHHEKPAFRAFLEAARRPSESQPQKWKVFVKNHEIAVEGAILIWGAATEDGKAQVKQCRGFHDVLTLAEICRDLRNWDCEEFKGLLREHQRWCNEMFDSLLGVGG